MSAKWTLDKIPDQSGKVAVVTGATSGIGLETARVLASKNATVILAIRNLEKGDIAADQIKAEYPDAKVMVSALDLCDLESIEIFAEKICNTYTQLDLLINNAGVMMPPYTQTSAGFELQMGTNHLGHFALTAQLFPLMKDQPEARIVNISSIAHKRGQLNLEDLNWEQREYNPIQSYADSKIANLYFTFALNERLQGAKGPMVLAAHPGWTATDLARHVGPLGALGNIFAQSIAMGTLPTLRAACDPDAKTGEYYGPKGFMEMRGFPVKTQAIPLAQDKDIAEQLWTLSERLTGVDFEI